MIETNTKNLDEDVLKTFDPNQKPTSEEAPLAKKTSLVRINYFCICFYAFLTGTDFAVVIPTLWDRLHVDYGASGSFMGVVMSAYSASGVLCGIVMGKISDDRPTEIKIFYLFCVFFSIFGHVLYFVGINKWFILVARLISGLCLGCTTVALAYIAKTSTLKQRTSLISMVMACRQLGLMVGPAFNLFLRETNFLILNRFVVDRKSSPGLFMALLWFLVFLLFTFVYKDPEAIKQPEENTELIQDTPNTPSLLTLGQKASHFIRIEILVLLVTTFFTYFNQTSLETVLIPFTEEYLGWNELHNSILFCVGGVCIISSYILIRFMTMKFADRFVLVTGCVFILIGLGISLICLFFIRQPEILISEAAVNSSLLISPNNSNNLTSIEMIRFDLPLEIKIGFGLAFTFDVFGLPAIAICSASLFTKLVDNNVQGIGQGVHRGILGLGTILGPLFAGPLISTPHIILGVCFGFIGLILFFVLMSYRRLRPLKK